MKSIVQLNAKSYEKFLYDSKELSMERLGKGLTKLYSRGEGTKEEL